jgi:hypothetical protein
MYMFNIDISNVKKSSPTIYYKSKIFVLNVLEILAPLSNLTWDFLHIIFTIICWICLTS